MHKIIKRAVVNEAPSVKIGCTAEVADGDKLSLSYGADQNENNITPAIRAYLDTIIQKERHNAALRETEAYRQAHEIGKKSRIEGFAQGREEGFVQGYQEVMQQMNEELLRATERAQQLIAMAEQQAQDTIVAAEGQIIDIVMAVCKKVLAREVDENEMAVVPIVKSALEKVREQEKIVIRLNAENYNVVLKERNELQAMTVHGPSIQIVVDPDIEKGGCVIDTDNGSISTAIDDQLFAIRQALEGALA